MTGDITNIASAIADRDRRSLDAKDRWTPREAVAAFLADIDAGTINPEAVCVVFSSPVNDGAASRVGRYCGSEGSTGSKDSFWIIGMIHRAASDWLRGE